MSHSTKLYRTRNGMLNAVFNARKRHSFSAINVVSHNYGTVEQPKTVWEVTITCP